MFLHLGLWSILKVVFVLSHSLLFAFLHPKPSVLNILPTWTKFFSNILYTSLMVINSPQVFLFIIYLVFVWNYLYFISFSVDVLLDVEFCINGFIYFIHLFFRFLKNSIPLFSGFCFSSNQFHSRCQSFEDTCLLSIAAFKTLVHFGNNFCKRG